MTLSQAIAQQPLWVQYWLYILVFGIVVLPLALLIWKQTRLTAVITVVASVIAGLGVSLVYDRFGYVKLIGLPHIILWTPLAYYLFTQIKRSDMPHAPRRIMIAVLSIFIISLVFDYVDVARYVLGEKSPIGASS
jgi:hypothetical protein